MARGRGAGRIGRVGALALLLLVSCASAAVAAAGHGAKGAAPALASAAAAAPAGKGTNSTIGAGEEEIGSVDTAGVTFKLPSFSCASSSDVELLMPGLWIYDANDNLADQIGVTLECEFGRVVQREEVCLPGSSCAYGSISLQPGDLIEATYKQGAGVSVGGIYDLTQNAYFFNFGNALPGDSGTVLFGVLGPAAFGHSAVPTFGSIPFSIATLDGHYLSDPFGLAVTRLNLQTSTDVQIAAGAAKTTSFKVSFKSNN